jgi:hypothetical protein
MATSRRLAFGLLPSLVGATSDERTEVRIQLALHANKLGYALIETFELTGESVSDTVVLSTLEAWADRLQADGLLVTALESDERVIALADRARLLLVASEELGWLPLAEFS